MVRKVQGGNTLSERKAKLSVLLEQTKHSMFDAQTAPKDESYVIVRITNRTDFDFTPAMGAMYGGVAMPIPAGKSLLAPKPAARHLAKHLARQVFIRNAPIRDDKETDGKGRDRALWTEEDIERTMVKFLAEEYEEEKKYSLSEIELLQQKIDALNKHFPPSETVTGSSRMGNVVETAPSNPPDDTPNGYKDKQEVIAELEKRGLKFDRRMSKENLEGLLK